MFKNNLINNSIFVLLCCLISTTLADTNQDAANKAIPVTAVPLPKANLDSKPILSTAASSILSNAVNAATSALPNHSLKTNTTNCVCDGALLPRIGDNGVEMEICPDCKCKHISRNTTLIKVVVILVIWIISILVIYMLFLMCLDPLLNKRVKSNYQEHTNEDDDTTSAAQFPAQAANQDINARANVLNRVGHQQDKWKRQVREQRRHIYDRRTMLN